MNIVALLFDVVLAAYVAIEVVRFVPRYRRLKEAVASGDLQARSRVYLRALAFEWTAAVLAMLALGLDWRALDPRTLGLGGSPLVLPFTRSDGSSAGTLVGVLVGVTLGTLALVAARRGRTAAPGARRRRLLPDFGALIPVTRGERALWLATAISAGICEELVFRGWLLATLHGTVGLGGTGLVVVAAALFGLAHAYQGPAGIVLTALAGVVFCALYVATGSLLVPVLVHALVDARFAILPAPRAVAAAGSAATQEA